MRNGSCVGALLSLLLLATEALPAQAGDLAAFVPSPGAAAIAPLESSWSLRLDEDGIRVHTRPVAESSLLEFRGSARMEAPIGLVVEFLQDESRVPEWIERTSSATRLAGSSAREGWVYTVMKLPWPLRDRDQVTHWTLAEDARGVVTISMESVPEHMPPHESRVRIPRSRGSWRVSPLDAASAEVVLQLYSDPGGYVPPWITNAASVDVPFSTLRNLRRMLADLPALADAVD